MNYNVQIKTMICDMPKSKELWFDNKRECIHVSRCDICPNLVSWTV